MALGDFCLPDLVVGTQSYSSHGLLSSSTIMVAAADDAAGVAVTVNSVTVATADIISIDVDGEVPTSSPSRISCTTLWTGFVSAVAVILSDNSAILPRNELNPSIDEKDRHGRVDLFFIEGRSV